MTAREANEQLAEHLRLVVQDAEALLKVTVGTASEKVDRLRQRLREAVDSARQSYGYVQEKTRLAAQATDRKVREYPYHSIGIAFALGLVVGVLVTPRKQT